MKRFLLAALLCLSNFVYADGISDATVYVPITTTAADIAEAVPWFPIYVSDLPAEFFAALAAESDTTCATCRFADSTGATEYPIYVPSTFNSGSETGIIFVRGTGMSASVDVDYRLYAGSPTAAAYAATDTYGRNAVFSGMSAVYSLTGTDALTDLTGNGFNLTASGAPTAGQTGPYEGLESYDFVAASSQYLYHADDVVAGVPVTMLSLVNSDSDSTNVIIAGIFSTASSSLNQTYLRDVSGGTAGAVFRGNGATAAVGAATGTFTTGTWTHRAATRDAAVGTAVAYRDGGNSGSDATTITAYSTQDRTSIGARLDSAVDGYFDGKISLTVFENSVLSADWIATYYTMLNTDIYTVGTAVELGSDCTSGSTGWVLFGAVAQTATADANWSPIGNSIVDDANTDLCYLAANGDHTESLLFDDVQWGEVPPGDADTYTISVRIKRHRQGGGGRDIEDSDVQLIHNGTPTGFNLADVGVSWPTTATTKTYSGPWGITPAWNADFGVLFEALSDDDNDCEVYVTLAEVKIDWDCGDDPTARTRGLFELAR